VHPPPCQRQRQRQRQRAAKKSKPGGGDSPVGGVSGDDDVQRWRAAAAALRSAERYLFLQNSIRSILSLGGFVSRRRTAAFSLRKHLQRPFFARYFFFAAVVSAGVSFVAPFRYTASPMLNIAFVISYITMVYHYVTIVFVAKPGFVATPPSSSSSSSSSSAAAAAAAAAASSSSSSSSRPLPPSAVALSIRADDDDGGSGSGSGSGGRGALLRQRYVDALLGGSGDADTMCVACGVVRPLRSKQ
jgi:hypothetical protein